jgi:hypothetical protein
MRIAAVVALLVAISLPRPAAAQTETFRDPLGCFTRIYDRTHLARHPDQRVTQVKLHISNYREGRYYDFEAWFKLRGSSKLLRTGGVCRREIGFPQQEPAGVRCSVACEGGGVNLISRAGGVLMYLTNIRVGECDEDINDEGRTTQYLTGGKDDRVFRLDRVDAAACTGMDRPDAASPSPPARPIRRR